MASIFTRAKTGDGGIKDASLWLLIKGSWSEVLRINMSGIKGSQYSHMRELHTQHEGRPFCTMYAFDPRRKAIL
jgi:hypothetical protein